MIQLLNCSLYFIFVTVCVQWILILGHVPSIFTPLRRKGIRPCHWFLALCWPISMQGMLPDWYFLLLLPPIKGGHKQSWWYWEWWFISSFQDKWCILQNPSWLLKYPLCHLGGVVLISLLSPISCGRTYCRLPSFRSKTIKVRKKVITHTTKQLGLIHCTATHTAQEHFRETEEASKYFITMIKHKIMGCITSQTWTKPPFLTPTIQARCLRQKDQSQSQSMSGHQQLTPSE